MAPRSLLAVLFACSLLACDPPAPPQTPTVPGGVEVAAEAPLIHSGEAHLDCTISARENGAQKLVLTQGAGLEFDVAVSPIVDGTVQTKGPEKGGSYRFSSHLAKPGTGTLSGVGAVTIEALETKVNVEMNRYDQPGGPGTQLTFHSEDMASRGIYIEFSGRALAANGDRYAFSVTLGKAGPGSGGSVMPQGSAMTAPIQSKMVMVYAPQTTVVTTTVTLLKAAH